MVQEDVLVVRSLIAMFAWRMGDSELLWSHDTELPKDLSKAPLAVRDGVAVTMYAASKSGPSDYEARRIDSGELLWRRSLKVRAGARGLCFGPEGLSVLGFDRKSKKDAYLCLDPESGETKEKLSAPHCHTVATVGDSVFLAAGRGLYLKEGSDFRKLCDDLLNAVVAKGDFLYSIGGFVDGWPAPMLRKWSTQGEELDSMEIPNLRPGGDHLLIGEDRLLLSDVEGEGPFLLDLAKKREVWRTGTDNRTTGNYCRLAGKVIAEGRLSEGRRNLEWLDAESGDRGCWDDPPYFHHHTTMNEKLVLSHPDGLQTYSIEEF